MANDELLTDDDITMLKDSLSIRVRETHKKYMFAHQHANTELTETYFGVMSDLSALYNKLDRIVTVA